MTKDDIIRMAREAGWGQFTAELHAKHLTTFFERAYKAGAAAEADRIASESKHIIKRAEERGAAAERADAERYRWLRDNNARFSWNPSKYNQETISGFAAFGTGYCGFEFEDAIDKAMGEE
jgi:hypothetical protein